MPDREQQQQKRKRHVNKKPAMEPMVKARLEIEHPSFVAPGLNLFDATAVGFGHAQLDETESVVGESCVTEAEFLAAPRLEIGENLAFD